MGLSLGFCTWCPQQVILEGGAEEAAIKARHALLAAPTHAKSLAVMYVLRRRQCWPPLMTSHCAAIPWLEVLTNTGFKTREPSSNAN